MALEKKFAIVDVFGRQFKVAVGDKIKANFVQQDAGTQMTFANVFMINDGTNLKVGAPHLAGAKVTAQVVEHGRGDKIIVYKYLRKNKSQKMLGHRQPFTTLSITSIEG